MTEATASSQATGVLPGLLFIVNSLETGGAEKQVVTLLNHIDTRRFPPAPMAVSEAATRRCSRGLHARWAG